MGSIGDVLKEIKEITPLWIIAIFLLMNEVIVTGALVLTSGNIQLILTIFACIFPILISGMFFIVLWFKSYAFYSPKEYPNLKDAPSFINSVRGVCQVSTTSESPRFIALFLIKTKIKSEAVEFDKILTYFSPGWESYFIVNRRYDPLMSIQSQYNDLIEKLSEVIGIEPANLSIKYVDNCDFENTKYSYTEKKDAIYHYKIFYVTISNADKYDYIINQSFTYGERTFRWMTIAEMKNDTFKTYERNSDIIRFLTDKFHELYYIPQSFLNMILLKI